MRRLKASLWGESIKVYRSTLPLISFLVIVFFTILMGFLLFILKHPELAGKSRAAALKASMLGNANWTMYFEILSMLISMGGLIGFGFITSWIFGREYSDHTIKDIIALPTPRSIIVMAKFIITGILCILISLIIFVLGLCAGWLVALDGWSLSLALESFKTYIVCALLTIVLCTPIAFFASYGRGYLPPMGFVVIIIGITQLLGFLGYGPYFPWAVPSLISGAAGTGSAHLGILSYIIVFFTGITGYAGTYLWWRFADQN